MNVAIETNKLADFTVETTGGILTAQDLVGQAFVFYFYPKDHTPGCTQESRDFAALHADFTQSGVKIYGVSRDSVKSHLRFKEKLALPFDLLADIDANLCRQFEVLKIKKMFGKEVKGIQRSTFLFDKAGNLYCEWRKVTVKDHVAAVLQAAKEMG